MINTIFSLFLIINSGYCRRFAENLANGQVKFQDTILQGKITENKVEFLGIPYAEPPVGDLRFRAPVRRKKLRGFRNATTFGPSCFQFGADAQHVTTPESEDCLTLNVFVPRNARKPSKLPVMLYFHGGSFRFGGSSNPYESLSNIPNNVIGVSMNYRLGAFGFLPGEDERTARNAGLLDQEMAMDWVAKYIHHFGGDRKQITAVGSSAGAMSIGAHLIAYQGEQDIFSRAVFLSGSPLVMPMPADVQEMRKKFILNSLGCADVACLKAKPPREIADKVGRFDYQISVDNFMIPQDSFAALQEGDFSPIPVIIHTSDDEGSMFGLVSSEQEAAALRRAQFGFFPENIQQQFDSMYPFNGPTTGGILFGDVIFKCPATETAAAMVAKGVTVYKARNSYKPAVDVFGGMFGPLDMGVAHTSELSFLLGSRPFTDPKDIEHQKLVQNSYFNFILGEAPSPDWQVYGSERNQFNLGSRAMEIDNTGSGNCGLINAVLKGVVTAVTGFQFV
jgi:para-nitrobenzyl esterase